MKKTNTGIGEQSVGKRPEQPAREANDGPLNLLDKWEKELTIKKSNNVRLWACATMQHTPAAGSSKCKPGEVAREDSYGFFTQPRKARGRERAEQPSSRKDTRDAAERAQDSAAKVLETFEYDWDKEEDVVLNARAAFEPPFLENWD